MDSGRARYASRDGSLSAASQAGYEGNDAPRDIDVGYRGS